MSDPRPWRARVLRPGGGVAGAGVLIDQRHVLTCAHVVNQALARGSHEEEPPTGEVEVDFVEAEAGRLGASVAEGGWVPIGPGGRGDMAVLKLSEDAPRGARPAVLRNPPWVGGHHFDTYGYPGRYDTGLGATGVLAAWGGPANHWVELQGVEVPGHRVERGFSGAAVYDQDARAVVGIVVAEDKLAEAKLAWMLPVRTLTQLLGPSWPRLTDIVRSAAMYGVGELGGHWSPKARGVEREAKRGWYFTGRRRVLQDLAAWLAGGQADGRVRVVTAGPGSGKSAVLARLVTLSDPLYREQVPDLDPKDLAVPPAGSIEVAVWAHAKTIEDVVAAIALATKVDAESPGGLINGLLERHQPSTIVVDALDEALEPAGIAGKVLRPLAADAASAGVRVLVGSRPGREDELVYALGRDAVRLDLDQPPYLERDDLVEFVRRRLLLADDSTARTPYRDREDLVSRVADAVAARAYPTFLVAQLTSKALVQAETVVDVESPGWELAFPGSVVDAMDGYLDRLVEGAATERERRTRKRRLRELLTPLAYAECDGLPRYLWPVKGSGTAGLAAVEQVKAQGGEVALVVADLWMPDMTGVEFLTRAHGLYPNAKRAVLAAWGDRRVGDTTMRATALGQIDDWGLKPWRAGDEQFHQLIARLLYEWAQLHWPGFQAVQVVGEQWSARAHELRDLLSRNKVLFGFIPADSQEGQALLDQVDATDDQLPVVVTFDGLVLRNPSNTEVAEALSATTRPRSSYDVIVLGAGPAGLAAAVYGASEGLRTGVLEPEAFGGQAGTSSMIRNYLGFPRGISGTELAERAYYQATGFGADIVYGQRASGLHTAGSDRVVTLADGTEVTSRAVILATGVTWRRLGVPSLEALVGAGVFYGAATSEAQAVQGEQVYVVGGANSAGQAAVHLAGYAAQVTLLVRRPTLAETMSDYLVKELQAIPNIRVRYNTEAVDGHGEGRLTGLTLRDRTTGVVEKVPATALFILIGAEPHTDWLPETILRDRWGFVLTGADLLADGRPPAGWPLERQPLLLETSLPGVFAAGDVRRGSIKRVASAVGEGSVAIRLVHEYLSHG